MIRIGDEFVPGPSAHGFFEQLVQACAYLNLGLCLVNLIRRFRLTVASLSTWSLRSAGAA
jgi:hypothetical protein